MAKKKQDNLMQLSNVAQTFTMSAALLYGVLWVITSLYNLEGDNLVVLSDALVAATVVGGITMGLLFLMKFLKMK